MFDLLRRARRPTAPPPSSPADPPAAPPGGQAAEWAEAQLMPWLGAPSLTRQAYAAELDRLNAAHHDLYVFDLAPGGGVAPRPKAAAHPVPFYADIVRQRADMALALLAEAAPEARLQRPVSIVVGVADALSELPPGVPLFGYQRPSSVALPAPDPLRGRLIQLPDPEFVQYGFYEGEPADPRPGADPAAKRPQVVFAGASTGKLLTAEDVRADATPRLAFAARFLDHPRVRVSIGHAADCDAPETAALLETKPYFRHVPFAEQLESRFVLSMDGHGATCSRVARTLRSRSVLVKVHSDRTLFYFPGLVPWRHYIPVRDADELDALSEVICHPDFPAARIADAANAFFQANLTRSAVIGYTAHLLGGFQEVVARMPA